MLHTPQTSITHEMMMDLQSAVKGSVITPDDPDYDVARMNWNVACDQRPALIVAALTAQDVAEAVRFAQRHHLQVAIKSTGHGAVLPADDGLLIVTTLMAGVEIDANSATARIEAGARWGAVLEAAGRLGLAPLLGSSPHVGAVGYTLGGGMGWLARQHGLAIDSVLSFEVVTPAGNLVHASADEHQALYWALRGGGGSFGAVVAMRIRLYPVTTVYAGNLYYPLSMAREVYARYREWVADAPDALTSAIVLMTFPPLPQLPDFLRGQSFVIVRGCFDGPARQGEALLRFWRDWQPPLIDDFGPMPFTESARISNDPVDPMPVAGAGIWLNAIDDTVIETLTETCPATDGPPPVLFAEIRHAGGAMSRIDPDATAFSLRQVPFVLHLISVTPTPAAGQAFGQFVSMIRERIAPTLAGGIYMNFTTGAAARAQTRAGYSPSAYDQLQRVKAAYDPDQRFDHAFDFNGG